MQRALTERPVASVLEEQIRRRIVGDVDVRPTVVVEIAEQGAEPGVSRIRDAGGKVLREIKGAGSDDMVLFTEDKTKKKSFLFCDIYENKLTCVDEEKKSALVVVADSQLSLAIGKNGQNVRLAARLTGWKIDIISATEYEKEKAERDKEIKAALAEEAEAQRQQEEARQQEKAQQEAEG